MNSPLTKKIEKRIFLVGSARSGTTLLQSILSSHPKVYSLPETHFFSKTIPMRRSKRIFWRFQKKDLSFFKNYLETVSLLELHTQLESIFNPHTYSLKQWIKSIILLLDRITLTKGYTIWLEKTPSHIRYIDLISHFFPEIVFIHIIRNGEDVIASLYDATHKYPELWGGARSLDSCITRWKRDILISSKYIGQKNHYFIKYEELVNKPEKQIRELCKKLTISYNPSMIENYSQTYSSVVLKNETWKENVKGKIEPKSKFSKVFTPEEQNYVKNKIRSIDLTFFNLET